MTSPADEIKAAAAKIRDLAKAATPGPWWPESPWLSDVVTSPLLGRVADCSIGTGYRAQSLDDAKHIAMWNPSVALLVADLLDSVSKAIDGLVLPEASFRQEIAIARAINGTGEAK